MLQRKLRLRSFKTKRQPASQKVENEAAEAEDKKQNEKYLQ